MLWRHEIVAPNAPVMSKIPSDPTQDDWPAPLYGWYAVFVLLLAYTFCFVDRQVLNLLVTPIQADLGITDFQIGLLQGPAFVLTYVLMSVPVGRMVDRFHRIAIMVGGILAWSAATVGCGLSRTFDQLLLSRLGVGAGEASVTPAAWSLLSDYFPPERLARPISVYLMGPYLGAGLAMILGAEVLDLSGGASGIALPLVGELAPWQFTFVAVGLPGVVIAAILLSMREPSRKGRASAGQATPPWPQVLAYVRANARIYLALLVGAPFIIVILYGLQGWTPTIMVRVYDWDLAQAGRVYGMVALVAGSGGVLTGPWAARRLEARGHLDYPLRLTVISAAGAALSLAFLPWQSNPYAGLACVAAGSFFVTLPLALVASAIQAVTPNEMRGVVVGSYVVTTNVIGLALGPTLVAACTDYLFRDPAAVAWSLSLVSVTVGPIAVAIIMTGMKAYARRIRGLADGPSAGAGDTATA